MDLEELVTGARKANLSELKELKVKVTVRLLVNLHYVKLTQSRAISDVVNEALTEYFAGVGGARAKGFAPPPGGSSSAGVAAAHNPDGATPPITLVPTIVAA